VILLFGIPALAPGFVGHPVSGIQTVHRNAGSAISRNALEAAASSLATGAGPAAGSRVLCPVVGLSASCGASPSASRPSTSPLAATTPNWSQVLPTSPLALQKPGMAYDAKDGYTVLFGGLPNGATNGTHDTWIFSGGSWTNVSNATHPAGRYHAAMTYDSADQYVLLFGGVRGSGVYSDTWKFVGGVWTRLTPAMSPPARWGASMAFDASSGKVVLFGGLSSGVVALSDTWTFHNGSWAHPTPVLHPSARAFSAMASDVRDNEVVLFGGWSAGTTLSDGWVYHNGTWAPISSVAAPLARYGEDLGYSGADREVVLFGGLNGTAGTRFSDTWTFAKGNWTKVGPAFHPSARLYSGVSDGPAGGSLLIFGGYSYLRSSALNDTWSFHANVWKSVHAPTPPVRQGAAMAYDEADGYVVLFGGFTATNGVRGDTWTFSGGVWRLLHLTIAPTARGGASMAYDQSDGYLLLFGGLDKGLAALHDTWMFQAGSWSPMPTAVGPVGRSFASLAYDAADGYAVLYGGDNGNGTTLNDSWTFTGGSWTAFVGPTPPARVGAAMSYDSADGELVLFGGGTHSGAAFGDTWTYLAGVWSNVTSSQLSTPLGVAFATLADDTFDGYVVLFGGHTSTFACPATTWVFTGGQWSLLSPSTSPPGRSFGETAYDAVDSEVVLFGGIGAPPTTPFLGDTWVY
jgi:hypothetical protein